MPNVKTRLTKPFRSNATLETDQPWCNLDERTTQFGENIIRFVKRLPMNAITEPIIRQLVKAGTNVGAHYCDAGIAATKRKYRKRISHCMESSRSAKYWLRMIATALPLMKREARQHWKEAEELNHTFDTMLHDKKKA